MTQAPALLKNSNTLKGWSSVTNPHQCPPVQICGISCGPAPWKETCLQVSSLFTHQIKHFLHPFAQNILATILITVVPTANTLIWATTLWALTESRALNHAESGQGQRFLLICADESGFQHWCSLVRWNSASHKNLTDSRFLICKWGTRAVPIL